MSEAVVLKDVLMFKQNLASKYILWHHSRAHQALREWLDLRVRRVSEGNVETLALWALMDLLVKE